MKVKDCWDANGNWNLNALSFAFLDQVHDIIQATPRPLLPILIFVWMEGKGGGMEGSQLKIN